jgi:ribosomal protein S18 acetylase RimI-like enzyme
LWDNGGMKFEAHTSIDSNTHHENTDKKLDNIFKSENLDKYYGDGAIKQCKDKVLVTLGHNKSVKILNDLENDNELLNIYKEEEEKHTFSFADEKYWERLNSLNEILYNEKSHEISQKDFQFVKDFSERDTFLLNQVFGNYDYLQKYLPEKLFKDKSLDAIVFFLRYCDSLDKDYFSSIAPTSYKYGSLHAENSSNRTHLFECIEAFLSLAEGDQEISNKIILLINNLQKKTAEKLFAKYGEIVDEANNVANYVSENIKGENNQDLNNTISETLLMKGKNLLSEYGDKVKVCKKEDCASVAKELEERLKSIQASTLTFGATVKELVKRGEFNMEEFKNLSLEETTSDNIEEKDKKSMNAIAYENTRQYPDRLAEYWYGTAKEALDKKKENEEFIIVRHKSDIASFMRVQENPDGSYYGASFNVNPFIKGSRIGTELLKKVIDDYTKKGDFTAEVWADNPMLQTYIKDFGFEIDGEIDNYHDTGVKVVKIIKRKQENKNT